MATINFITPEELQEAIKQAMEPLQKRIAFLEKITPLWLDSKTAAKAIGVSIKTLERERACPGTLLKVSYEGEKGTKPVYCVHSIQAYKESKTLKRPKMAVA